MNKSIKLIIIYVIGIITGILILFSYATTYNSEEISYDNSTSGSTKTNVKDAVDELYQLTGHKIICRRATTLHNDGTHTFGQLGTRGTLASGDAFDCDVNDDKVYNSETERFYYVTDLDIDNNIAILIYYSNTSNGVATPSKTIAYNEDNVNNKGPVTAVADLPSLSQWKTTIYSNPRQIKYENGNNVLSYNYEGLAARLLTMQELRRACGKTDNMTSEESLNTCTYTMENTKYADASLPYGYWLETPRSITYNTIWFMNCNSRFLSTDYTNTVGNNGVRPVIEVLKSEISY